MQMHYVKYQLQESKYQEEEDIPDICTLIYQLFTKELEEYKVRMDL